MCPIAAKRSFACSIAEPALCYQAFALTEVKFLQSNVKSLGILITGGLLVRVQPEEPTEFYQNLNP